MADASSHDGTYWYAFLDDEGLRFARVGSSCAQDDEGADDAELTMRESPLGDALLGSRAGDKRTAVWPKDGRAPGPPGGALSLEVLATRPELRPQLEEAWRVEQAGDLSAAAAIYASIGNHAAAARRFERAGNLRSAAASYERAELYALAAGAHAAAGDWAGAGRCHERIDEFGRAAEAYARAGEHHSAAVLLERLRRWAKAADSYLDANEPGHAGRCFERAGMLAQASEAYGAAGEPVLRAQCEKRLGHWREAAQCYQQGGELMEAARCFEEAGDLGEATRSYTDAGAAFDVARCEALVAEALGDYLAAARAFERAAQSAWWSGDAEEFAARAQACRERADAGPHDE